MADSRFEALNTQPAQSEPLNALQAERVAEMFGASAGNRTARSSENQLLIRTQASGDGSPDVHALMDQQFGELRKLLGSGLPTNSEKTILEAGKLMSEAGDPKTGLSKAEPQFKQAIDQADEALGAVGAKVHKMSDADGQRAADQARKSQSLDDGLHQEMLSVTLPEKLKAKLTEDQQREELPKLREKVAAEIEAFMKTHPGDYAYRGLQADLEQYPNIYAMATQRKAVEDSEPYKTVKGLQSEYRRAMADSVLSRMTYGEALGRSGRETEAWGQMREALGMLGLKLPKNLPGTFDASI
ncbi:MAG TPA: hypothetical protein V6D22_07610 [Candidatus Obscuribacterales bacterium]